MCISDLQSYAYEVSEKSKFCVVVHSIESNEEIAASYDVVVNISKYGELMISIWV